MTEEQMTKLLGMADDYRELEAIEIHKGVLSIKVEYLPRWLVEDFAALIMDAVETEKRNAKQRMIMELEQWRD